MSIIAGILTLLGKVFSMDGIAAILESQIATFLIGAGSSVYKRIFSGAETASYEKFIDKCFNDAVGKTIVNSDIAEYTKYREKKDYRKFLKDELFGKGVDYKHTNAYKRLLEEFELQLAKNPITLYKINKEYGKRFLAEADAIREELQSVTSKLDLLTGNIEGIYTVLDSMNMKSGYNFQLSKECGCLPEHNLVLSHREDLVAKCKACLDSHNIIFIHGSYQSGKTILSEMLASKYNQHAKVKYEYGQNKSIDCLPEIKKLCKDNECRLFILDAVNYTDPSVVQDFISTIKIIADNNHLFIINSAINFADYCRFSIEDFNVEVPFLNSNEIKGLLVEHENWTTAVHAISAGHPAIVQLLLAFLNSKQWSLNVDDFLSLMRMPKGTPEERIMQNVICQMITDSDTYVLLNRLMLWTGRFDDGLVRLAASVDKAISSPARHVSFLTGNWIIKDNDTYRLSPLLKALNPDLLPEEIKETNKAFANYILAKGTLNELDVLAIINYRINAKEYDDALGFYLSVTHKLGQQDQLMEQGAYLIRNLWLTLPLPKEASVAIKASVRIHQIMILGLQYDIDVEYVAKDLLLMLEGDECEDKIKGLGYYVLTLYQTLKRGNLELALKYKSLSGQIDLAAFNMTDVLQSNEELKLAAMTACNTLDQLKSWMSDYAKSTTRYSKDLFDLAYGILNLLIKDKDANSKEELLQEVINHAKENPPQLYPFIVYSYVILIQLNSHDYPKLQELQEEIGTLTFDNTGAVKLNWYFGYALKKLGKQPEAEVCFSEAIDRFDYSAAGYEYILSVCNKYHISNNIPEARKKIEEFIDQGGYDSLTIDEEKYVVKLAHIYTLFETGAQQKAVENLLQIENYLWTLWQSGIEENDFVKLILVKTGIVVNHYADNTSTKDKSKFITPSLELIGDDDMLLAREFTRSRYYVTSLQLLDLVDTYMQDITVVGMLFEHAIEYYPAVKKENHHDFIVLLYFYFLVIFDLRGCKQGLLLVDDILDSMASQHLNIQNCMELLILQIMLHRLYLSLSNLDNEDEVIIQKLKDISERYNASWVSELIVSLEGQSELSGNWNDGAHLQMIKDIVNYDDLDANSVFVLMFKVYTEFLAFANKYCIGHSVSSIFSTIISASIENRKNGLSLRYYQDGSIQMKSSKYVGYDKALHLMRGFYSYLTNPPIDSKVEDLMIG